MSRPRLEVCVDDPAGLAAAVAGGADRIELCAALDVGGLTPSPGLMAQAAASACETFAMIRPRAGDFVFDALELDVMRRDIDAARAAGLAGVVLGASLADGCLDQASLAKLIAHATGLRTTLHRAFDVTPDKNDALEAAIGLGFDRILTSGGRRSAPEAAEVIEGLVAQSGGRIAIMAGSGLTPGNVGELVRRTGVAEVHASCRASVPAASAGPAVDLGFASPEQPRTSRRLVEAMISVLEGIGC